MKIHSTPRIRIFAALFAVTLAGAFHGSTQNAQGLKPVVSVAFSARLKSCPDTSCFSGGVLARTSKSDPDTSCFSSGVLARTSKSGPDRRPSLGDEERVPADAMRLLTDAKMPQNDALKDSLNSPVEVIFFNGVI